MFSRRLLIATKTWVEPARRPKQCLGECERESKKVTKKRMESARKGGVGFNKEGESMTEKANVLQSLSPQS